MSQAGIIDLVNNNPQIPTSFTTDAGTAIPIANNLEILGGVGITTSGSGNTVTIDSIPGTGLTLTGNTGGAISPVAGNWNTVGSGSITVAGTAGTLTTHLNVTNHAVQVGAADGITLTQVSGGFDGQVFLAATLGDPAFRYLTSTGGTISYSIGPNALNLEAGATVPTTFNGNSGSATPAANILNIVGTGSISTTGAGNTITASLVNLTNHNVLVGAGTATITKVAPSATSGVPLVSNGAASDPSFSTALIAGGGTAATSFSINGVVISNTTGTGALAALTLANGQFVIGSTGTTPVASTLTSSGGTITITPGAGTLNIDLAGGSIGIDTIAVQATTAPGVSPVVPTAAGLVTINGTAVAAQTIPIQSRSIAVNSLQIEAQRASTSASTNATQQGLASFDSASFSVDANGWVQLAGAGLAIDSIHPDSGTDPVVPTAAGLVNIVGSGSTTTVGSLNTLTVQLTGLTQYNVLVGAGSTTITKVAPGATGIPLISQGVAANPAFGTAAIAGGGTNATSFTQTDGIVTYNGTSLVNYAGPQISSAGRATNSTQPNFSSQVSGTISNVTGDGTVYTILFDTENYDNGSNYNPATGIFTAPVAGKYFFYATIYLTGFAVHTLSNIKFYFSTTSFHYVFYGNLTPLQNNGDVIISGSCMRSMAASDTVEIRATVSGSTKTISVGTSGYDSSFGGYLIFG